jgi:thymidylate kinase
LHWTGCAPSSFLSTLLLYALGPGKTAILDRSVYSDWVFAEKNRLDGNISEEGFAYYEALRAQLLAELPLPHFTLYLDVSPEECYRRVHTLRKRDCESGIPLEYLSGLHHCYGTLVDSMRKQGSCTVRVQWEKFGSSADVAAALLAHTATHTRAETMQPFANTLDVERLRHPALKPELRQLSHRFEDDIFSDYSPDIERLHDVDTTAPADTACKRKADHNQPLSDEERLYPSGKSVAGEPSEHEFDPEELTYGPMPGVRKTSGVRLVQPQPLSRSS